MSAISNARWLTLSQASRVILQMISLFILSRLLQPSEYGLLAMATVATNFAFLLRDMGTGAAVVQKENLTEETKSTVFWLNVAMGFLLTLALLIAAPFMASYFRIDKLAAVLCLLSIVFPITSASAVHQSLLERRSGFKTLARIEITSAVLGLIVAITLAYLGFGVYSLVWNTLASAICASLQLWAVSPWRPKKIWDAAELRSLWGFSGNLTGFNFINFFARNADSIVIGRVLGSVQLGIYGQAYKVMMFPLQSMSYVAGRALFPVMSRQQADRPKMAHLYFRSLRLIATLTAPMMAGLWLLREPFVAIALGPRWTQVPIVLAWLAPVGFLQSLISTTGSVFMSTGRTDLLMRLGLLGSVLQVGSFFIGVNWGIEGVACCYLIANILNGIPHFYFALRELHSNFMGLFMHLWQPVLFSLVMLAAIYPLYSVLSRSGFTPQLVFSAIVVTGSVIYAVLTLLFSKAVVQNCKQMLGMKSA
jgi:O-antigen/teichoic acid export membrane protein